MKSKNILSNFNWLTFGGISGALILCFIIVSDEVLSAFYGGDLGAFLWTTFHFILNPVLCFIYIIISVVKGFRIKRKSYRIRAVYLLLVLLAISYIYIAFSGNTTWPKMLGINFQ